jgi:hypothetical protein
MKKSTQTILIVGGLAAAYYFWKHNSTAAVLTTQNTSVQDLMAAKLASGLPGFVAPGSQNDVTWG